MNDLAQQSQIARPRACFACGALMTGMRCRVCGTLHTIDTSPYNECDHWCKKCGWCVATIQLALNNTIASIYGVCKNPRCGHKELKA
jgi:hypothetical protein